MRRFRRRAVGRRHHSEAGGPLALPDSMAYEPASGRYMLGFMSSWRDIPTAVTVLYVQRRDLFDAFAKPAYPVPWNCPLS